MGSLSGISSVLSPVLAMTGIPGAIVGAGTQLVAQQKARDDLRAQQGAALTQLQAQQSLAEQQASNSADLQKQQIAADAALTETRRKQALRRAVAKQKTLFSAQGLSPADSGSGEAVLLGLYNDSEEDSAAQTQSDALRNAALDQSLASQKQKNLLEATQLAERQNLTRIINGY